jgi:uracil-DNA glycosylase family 4
MVIEHELMKCTCIENSCPAFSRCCFLPTECHPDIEGKVSILFIGQGGGSDERKVGRPFIGRAGSRLRQQVLFIRKKLKKHIGVAFSNTIRDNPDGNRIPTPQEYKHCLKHLYKDIAELKKRGLGIIVLLGNASKSAFFPQSGAMVIEHGKISNFSNEIFGHINAMSTYHPSYVMRTAPKFNDVCLSEYDKVVLKDILKAYEYCKNIKQVILADTIDNEGVLDIDVSDII